MSLDQLEMGAPSKQWPGERQPTRWDVHDANESPASTFLDRFRAALLLSEGAEEALLDSDPLIDDDESLHSPVSVLLQMLYIVWSADELCPSPNRSTSIHIRWLYFQVFQNCRQRMT
jgi:hypothetical protein